MRDNLREELNKHLKSIEHELHPIGLMMISSDNVRDMIEEAWCAGHMAAMSTVADNIAKHTSATPKRNTGCNLCAARRANPGAVDCMCCGFSRKD